MHFIVLFDSNNCSVIELFVYIHWKMLRSVSTYVTSIGRDLDRLNSKILETTNYAPK